MVGSWCPPNSEVHGLAPHGLAVRSIYLPTRRLNLQKLHQRVRRLLGLFLQDPVPRFWHHLNRHIRSHQRHLLRQFLPQRLGRALWVAPLGATLSRFKMGFSPCRHPT